MTVREDSDVKNRQAMEWMCCYCGHIHVVKLSACLRCGMDDEMIPLYSDDEVEASDDDDEVYSKADTEVEFLEEEFINSDEEPIES